MFVGLVAIRRLKHGVQKTKAVVFAIVCLGAYDGDDSHAAHVDFEEVDSCDRERTSEVIQHCFQQLRQLMQTWAGHEILLRMVVRARMTFMVFFKRTRIGETRGMARETLIEMVALLLDVIEQRDFAVGEPEVISLLSQTKAGSAFRRVGWDRHMMRTGSVI